MSEYRRLGRTLVGAGLTLLMVLFGALPGVAAGYPTPRDDEWWFTAWAIEDKVWPVSQGEGVTVAVLDTGVQASLSELAGVVLPGVDVVTGSSDATTDQDASSFGGHGTAMAGLIAGQGGVNRYVGVAPRTKILPVRVEPGNETVIPSGIKQAVDRGAKVIVYTGGYRSDCGAEYQEAVNYAIEHDVIVVAGAGDTTDLDTWGTSVGACVGVLTVGAIDNKRRVWDESRPSKQVVVAAPGVSIGVVTRNEEFGRIPASTDAAAALTAGVAALLRSKFPKMSAREVVQRIIATTRDAGLRGHDNQTGHGVVIPAKALTNDVPKSASNPPYASYDKLVAERQKIAEESQRREAEYDARINKANAKSRKARERADRNSLYLLVGVGAVGVVVTLTVVFLIVRGRHRTTTRAVPPVSAGYSQVHFPTHSQEPTASAASAEGAFPAPGAVGPDQPRCPLAAPPQFPAPPQPPTSNPSAQ